MSEVARHNPWWLYDELAARIPQDVLIRDVIMGARRCLVSAECGVGLAATSHGGQRLGMPCEWQGKPLRDLARYARSWSFEVASAGVAALNAWYNQPDYIRQVPLMNQTAESEMPEWIVGGCANPFEALRGCMKMWDETRPRPRVRVVGHFPGLESLTQQCDLAILERAPRGDDDLPDPACEFEIPGSDVVIMTGMTLENKTAPRLLELAQSSLSVMTGPTTTMGAPLFEAGVDILAGSIVTDPERAQRVVASGAGIHELDMLEYVAVATPQAYQQLITGTWSSTHA